MYHVTRTLKHSYRHDRYTVQILQRGPHKRVIVPVFTEYNHTPIPAEEVKAAMLNGLYRSNGGHIDVEFAYDVSGNPYIVKNIKQLCVAAKGNSPNVGVVEFATKKLFVVPHFAPDLILVMPCELDRALVSSLRGYGAGHGRARIRTATPEIAAFAREIGVIVEDL